MGTPDHLICLLRNPYADQEATARTGHGTTDWFQIGKGVHQDCILSPCLFNLEKEMATYSSILAWKIPWTEELIRLQSIRLQRVGHEWATSLFPFTILCELSLWLLTWLPNGLPQFPDLGFPCGSAGKESACNVADLGLIPGLGRSPGEGKGYPLQYSGLENCMDCIVHGIAKSRTRLTDFHFTFISLLNN